MKSNIAYMVRAFDKELKRFEDLKRNKKQRRQVARDMAVCFGYDEMDRITSQDEADEIAADDIYYLTN